MEISPSWRRFISSSLRSTHCRAGFNGSTSLCLHQGDSASGRLNSLAFSGSRSSHAWAGPDTCQVSRKTPWRAPAPSQPLLLQASALRAFPKDPGRRAISLLLPAPSSFLCGRSPPRLSLLHPGSELTPAEHSLFVGHGAKHSAYKFSIERSLQQPQTLELSHSQQWSVSEPQCLHLEEKAARGPPSLENSHGLFYLLKMALWVTITKNRSHSLGRKNNNKVSQRSCLLSHYLQKVFGTFLSR